MTVTKFAIKIINNPSLTYSAGQQVQGVLCIVNDEECTTTGVRLQFSGTASVKFRFGNALYIGKNEYFNVTVYVLGDGRSTLKLPPGARAITFGFPLPRDSPSSFVGEHGKIVYELEAVMERPWRFNNECKVALNVNGILDLNKIPKAILPVTMSKSKTVGFFCCQSGPVSFRLRLPKRAFLPGERINFIVELTNHSKKIVTQTCIKVVQKLGYHVKGQALYNYQYICAAEGPQVPSWKSELRRGFLRIPASLPLTRPVGVDVISIVYAIRVEMNIDGFSLPLKGEVMIVIGTVPFRAPSSSNRISELRNEPVEEYDSYSDELPLLPSSDDQLDDSFPDDLPPPSYEEAVGQDAAGIQGMHPAGPENEAFFRDV